MVSSVGAVMLLNLVSLIHDGENKSLVSLNGKTQTTGENCH